MLSQMSHSETVREIFSRKEGEREEVGAHNEKRKEGKESRVFLLL
jgi:hypothetical protein